MVAASDAGAEAAEDEEEAAEAAEAATSEVSPPISGATACDLGVRPNGELSEWEKSLGEYLGWYGPRRSPMM